MAYWDNPTFPCHLQIDTRDPRIRHELPSLPANTNCSPDNKLAYTQPLAPNRNCYVQRETKIVLPEYWASNNLDRPLDSGKCTPIDGQFGSEENPNGDAFTGKSRFTRSHDWPISWQWNAGQKNIYGDGPNNYPIRYKGQPWNTMYAKDFTLYGKNGKLLHRHYKIFPNTHRAPREYREYADVILPRPNIRDEQRYTPLIGERMVPYASIPNNFHGQNSMNNR